MFKKVGYTFDAGPNACLYMLKEHVSVVNEAIKACFPTDLPSHEYYKGIPIDDIGQQKASQVCI